MKNQVFHQKITACVNYQAYRFALPSDLSTAHYQILRQFIADFGENINPPEIPVLHILHAHFFIQFPSYGFPYFKVNFYPQVPLTEVQHYLRLFNNQLHYLCELKAGHF